MDADDELYEETVALILFPMKVGSTMMKAQYQQVMSQFVSPAARERAKPHIGQTRAATRRAAS